MKTISIQVTLNVTISRTPLVTCPLGHVTHDTLACDAHSLCLGKVGQKRVSQTAMCKVSESHSTPYFRCESGVDYVPYSVLCDWRQDCGDHSDEAFCQFPPCAHNHNAFDCGQGQCIHKNHLCDDIVHCMTYQDENECPKNNAHAIVFKPVYTNAVVYFDKPGTFSLSDITGNLSHCPETHFQCPGDGICLPIFTKCNGIKDCPGHEDEAQCDLYTCEGLYRCRGDKTLCMHVQHLCDGNPQCPQRDDELLCDLNDSCPDHCVCYGMKVFDDMVFEADSFPKIRYLEGRGSGLSFDDVRTEIMLIYLGAGACGWANTSYFHLPNLHTLDISDNSVNYINAAHFSHLHNLQNLDLSGNPLTNGFFNLNLRNRLISMLSLNLSLVSKVSVQLHALNRWVPDLKIVDFSHSSLITLQGLELFTNLEVLDLEGCYVSDYKSDFMKGMKYLQLVVAEEFRLCCPAMLPDNFQEKCIAPGNEISSCDNLLKSVYYRVALAIFAATALLGNAGSFVYRLWFSTGKRKAGYAVFVLHLSVSDFVMGVYLTIIGLADHSFAGSYLWEEFAWKKSMICRIAGFLSLMSCEVSSLLICLISLDRFLVIRFPFSRLHFRTTSAHVASVVSWGIGVTLASIPLLPVTSHWAFYSQTGICIPLPITRADFPGRYYSFGVMIVFNLVIFMVIVAGQALIYWTIKASTMQDDMSKTKDSVTGNKKTKSKEATIARRLLIVVMSDFLCWFPIGVCGLLARLEVPIPGEVNVGMAVFVMPFNSALNPFLYTYTIVHAKLDNDKEAKLEKFITEQMALPCDDLD